MSSRGAFRGEPDTPAYGASKAGLNAMSQSLAQKLAPYNIFVGVVAPGFVKTDMAADDALTFVICFGVPTKGNKFSCVSPKILHPLLGNLRFVWEAVFWYRGSHFFKFRVFVDQDAAIFPA